jgi:hypothetical protein
VVVVVLYSEEREEVDAEEIIFLGEEEAAFTGEGSDALGAIGSIKCRLEFWGGVK